MATDLNGVILGAPPAGTIPHFAIPFVIGGDGSAQVLQQDSVDEIVQSVAMLCGTRPGTRLVVPSYGILDPTFEGFDSVRLQLAAAKWEERASVVIQVTPDNEEVVSVGVNGKVHS